MTEYERNELAAENDGYTNDFQRAYAVSCIRREPQHGKAKALELVAQGLFVGVEFAPEYCPITDAVMGERCSLIAHGLTREEVAARLADIDPQELGDSRFEIWPHEAPAPVAVIDNNDDIPF